VTAGTAEAGTAAAARAAAVMMAIAGIISSSDIEELFLRPLEEKSFRGLFSALRFTISMSHIMMGEDNAFYLFMNSSPCLSLRKK
jgi:hypothetical protein